MLLAGLSVDWLLSSAHFIDKIEAQTGHQKIPQRGLDRLLGVTGTNRARYRERSCSGYLRIISAIKISSFLKLHKALVGRAKALWETVG